MSGNPVFSLIMATCGRTSEVENFLKTIVDQQFMSYEVIIVDQNNDERLSEIISKYSGLARIVHVKIPVKGLSHARNVGMGKAAGEFFLFPDDDSEYPEGLLAAVRKIFDEDRSLGLLSGRITDKITSNPTLIKCPSASAIIFYDNIWFTVTSGSLAVRRSVFECGDIKFDERFGLGGKYRSAEEIDLVARIIRSGVKCLYVPDVVFFHPEKESDFSDETIKRAGSYAYGAGAVCCKLITEEHVWQAATFFIGRLLRPIAMIIMCALMDRKRSEFYYAYLDGRIRGFKDFWMDNRVRRSKGDIPCV